MSTPNSFHSHLKAKVIEVSCLLVASFIKNFLQDSRMERPRISAKQGKAQFVAEDGEPGGLKAACSAHESTSLGPASSLPTPMRSR